MQLGLAARFLLHAGFYFDYFHILISCLLD